MYIHVSATKTPDRWSIGCIFGEMLLQQPVFPGSDYIHQLKLIVKLLGRPQEDNLWFVNNRNAMNFMLQLPDYKPQDMRLKFPKSPDAALELLATMLRFDPKSRTSLRDALEHRFVEECVVELHALHCASQVSRI